MADAPSASATNESKPVEQGKPADTTSAPPPAKPVEKPADTTPGWMKAEIAGEREKRRQAEARTAEIEREREEARQEAAKHKAELERLRNPPAQTQRPKRDDFQKPEDYDAALLEFGVQEAARQFRDEQRAAEEKRATETRAAAERQAQQTAEQQVQAEQRQLAEQWLKRREDVLKTHPDFAEVAEREDLTITMPMLDAMWREDNGPLIAYHLGKHPEEAQRISQLPAGRQAAEIGKLSARLERQPVSKAPPPLTPVGSSDRSGPRKLEELTMEEYAAQHATRRGR